MEKIPNPSVQQVVEAKEKLQKDIQTLIFNFHYQFDNKILVNEVNISITEIETQASKIVGVQAAVKIIL